MNITINEFKETMKNRSEIFRTFFRLFTVGEIPDEIFDNYISDINDGEYSLELQDWVINNTHDHLTDIITGIGIIESVEHLYKCSYENGVIK